MNQPLIPQVPLAQEPFFVASNFEKHWDEARIRPMRAAIDIEEEYEPGLPPGAHPSCRALVAPFRQSMPYPPALAHGYEDGER